METRHIKVMIAISNIAHRIINKMPHCSLTHKIIRQEPGPNQRTQRKNSQSAAYHELLINYLTEPSNCQNQVPIITISTSISNEI